jgi:hypothetical protein
VLKASSWRVYVLIQTMRRIDRRCPHSDRRIIWCYCLYCSSSATRPTLLENGPSIHPTVPRVSTSVPTRPTIALTLAILVPSVHPSVYFLLLSCSVLTLDLLILACGILASLGPRSVYKDMLNNKVSPNDHVVMNHQNQTRTNGIWGHVRYKLAQQVPLTKPRRRRRQGPTCRRVQINNWTRNVGERDGAEPG